MALLCEARIPTYRRPDLLRRAIESLRAQSHAEWRAIVFDDSPDREAEAVVREVNDARIQYRPNATRMGAAGNIDQVFAPGPFGSGDFAFILEDDAALHPDYLRENIQALESTGGDLLLRNQAIYEDGAAGWADSGETTRGRWIEAGLRSPLEIHALLFFMEGVSNGGLFWRLGRGIDLQVGPAVTDAGLQECCRTLRVNRPLLFAAEPLAIFTRLPASQIERSVTSNRAFARGTQALRLHLWKTYREPILAAAEAIAQRTGSQPALAQALLEIGCYRAGAARPNLLEAMKLSTKGAARRLLVANPVANFLPTLALSAS